MAEKIIEIGTLDEKRKQDRLKWLNARQRWMRCVLYPESQQSAIDYIRACFPCLMALHDKDIKEDGSPEKPHYHIIIHLVNGRKPTSVAKKLGVATGYLLPVDSAVDAEDYLTHDTAKAREDGKYHYSKDIVECYNDYVFASDDGVVDSLVMANDMFLIMSCADSYFGFVEQCLLKGYYNELKRSSSIWANLWNERRRQLGLR